jgi:hypothetical protein
LCVLLAAGGSWLPARAELPSLQPQQTLSPAPPDIAPPPFDDQGEFGFAVAVRGNLALVGMPQGAPATSSNTGRVVTYSRGADGVWKRTGALTGQGHFFGMAIAFRDNIAAITSDSALHIFKFQTTTGAWKLLNTIVPGGVVRSVDYQDGRIALCADNALFVYDIDAAGKVVRQARLAPRADFPRELFGFDVAMTRDIIVVGAPRTPSSGSTGAVHIFRLRDGQWVRTQLLTPIDGRPGDRFGFAVGIDKGMILVGAPEHQQQGAPFRPPTSVPVAGGAVYVYTPAAGRWVLQTKLRPTPEEHPFYVAFGLQIAMFDTKVAVVAVYPREIVTLDDRFLGLAFAYDRVGSDLTAYAVARPESGLRVAGRGQAVSIFGMTLLAGAPLSQCSISCIGNAISFDLRKTTPFP